MFYYFIIVSCFHLSLASWLLFSNKVQFSSVCANFADKYMDGENEVLNYINKLRTNSSSKPDGLPPIFVGRPLGQAIATGNPSVRLSVCNVGVLWPNGLSDRDDFWHTPCPGQQ